MLMSWIGSKLVMDWIHVTRFDNGSQTWSFDMQKNYDGLEMIHATRFDKEGLTWSFDTQKKLRWAEGA